MYANACFCEGEDRPRKMRRITEMERNRKAAKISIVMHFKLDIIPLGMIRVFLSCMCAAVSIFAYCVGWVPTRRGTRWESIIMSPSVAQPTTQGL